MKREILFIFIILFFMGCGYKFSGTATLPQGISGVYIKFFENHSADTGIENSFTNSLIDEFTRRGTKIDSSKNDAIISGIITSVSTETISHRGPAVSNERRVTVSVDIKLIYNEKIIRNKSGISDNETYIVSDNKLVTEQNRAYAIKTISKRIAERAFNSLTDNF
ncbi:MAG: LptE family protein [Desulfobacterales bacterium]|nr:LptE family protein [Desulfobacterales bacterium]